MRTLKQCGSFALSFVALSIVLSGVFSSPASAASPYDDYFTVADTLKIAPAGENVTEAELCDFSTSWAGIFHHDDVHQDMKDLWAQRTGWSVSRVEGGTSTQLNGQRYFGYIDVSFYIDGQPAPGAYWVDTGTIVSATWSNAYSMRFQTNSDCEMIPFYTGENPSTGNPSLWVRRKNLSRYNAEPFLTYNMPINYPTGFEGEEIRDSWSPTLQPVYSYTVAPDGKINVLFLETLDETYQLTDPTSCKIFETGDTFDLPAPMIDEHTTSPTYLYSWYTTLPDEGYYLLHCEYQNDETDLDVNSAIFEIYWDGQSALYGTNLYGCGEENICNSEEFNDPCNSEDLDISESFNCRITQTFNFGVLNPSITAFKLLLRSFVVPAEPSCNINIPDVTIAPNQTFQSSTLVPTICSTVGNVRNTYPVIVFIVNGVFALLFLGLIVKLINRITDEESHRLVEGVESSR